MNIEVNGETHHAGESVTVAELLDELGYADKRVAVERNGDLVPRSRHDAEQVEAGDRIEIVQAIGGG